MRPRARAATLLAIFALAAAVACGSSDATDPSTPAKLDIVSGDKETTAVATAPNPPLVVRVRGGGGAPLSGAKVTWEIVTGGGTLAETTTTTDAEGHAQAKYTPGTVVGAATVQATVGNLFPASFTLTLVHGPAASVVPGAGDGAAALVGSSLPIYARVVDQYGNAVAGVTVTFQPLNGGSVSAASSTTNASGLATTNFTLGADPMVYKVSATAASLPAATISVTGI